jgi:hypothetical protein
MVIGMLIFRDMTQLGFTGPYEVFASLPNCSVKVIASSLAPSRRQAASVPTRHDRRHGSAPRRDLRAGRAGRRSAHGGPKRARFPAPRGGARQVEKAKEIQLVIEYNPALPFDSGHPSTADAAIVADVRRKRARLQSKRREQAQRAAAIYCR